MENDSLSVHMQRVLNKLDLLIELINAQNDEDWELVNDVCEKLDAMKNTA
jgi:hypothetical protein